ncbi:NUDIX domain-containing protein [Nonomuraea recticatena]|uniref:NUDIX domain-containing protein n=1 Tax=Nonomuraea recticatena TaxID=46178 RepID=UPI003619DD3D
MGEAGELLPFDLLKAQVTANLALLRPVSVPVGDGLRRAAVAVCVLRDGERPPYTIVIKRAARGRNAGQWALPGGRLEDGEQATEGRCASWPRRRRSPAWRWRACWTTTSPTRAS